MSGGTNVGDRALGESGLTEALTRLRERLRDPAAGDPLISLAETLEWCYGLDKFHERGSGGSGYRRLRDGWTDGQTLAGLTFARGRFTHGLIASAHLVTLRPGRTMRMGGSQRHGGGVIYRRGAHTEYRWKSVAELRGRPGDRGEKFYEAHVAGKPILPPLETAERFLTQIA